MSYRTHRLAADRTLSTPFIALDVARVEENYLAIKGAIPGARIHYAVKANPARPVLDRVVALGGCFDAASWPEIEMCLQAGADPATISFGTTIKRSWAIAEAFRRGVRLFAFDTLPELLKIAVNAPGAAVYCRLAVDNRGAACPLDGKFGTDPMSARSLLLEALRLGLDPAGLSFHVGSQQTDPASYVAAIRTAADVARGLAAEGLKIRLLNIGGGMPARYMEDVPGPDVFGAAIMQAVEAGFAGARPTILVEPGRSMVADAGVLVSEVILACSRSHDTSASDVRWVYLDIGRFGGLAETEGEAIAYRITTSKDGGETGPVILAGPTCDSMDTLYKTAGYRLPLDLAEGDRVVIHAAGAYVSTYASRGFNGFEPPGEHFV